jgi:glycerol kinase
MPAGRRCADVAMPPSAIPSRPRYILALDQGTTSSRAILFDRAGQPVATAQQEFTQHYPQPGWVEHDASDLWRTQLACARQVLLDARIDASQVAGIGIANQRETTLVWDRATGAPIARAIVWQDRRTAGHCERLRAAGHAPFIAARTGLELDAYFSATKLAWLLEHVPGALARAVAGELAFGTVDSWLAFQLCGRHVTDASNASRTMLFNLHTLAWDAELLALFDIPAALLPEIVPSAGVLGMSDPSWFGRPIPIAGIAGDQQAATFGQACHRPGMVKNTYGTGCFMLMHAGATPPVSTHRLLATVGWQLGGATDYLLEGSVFMGGATVQWLRDSLGIIPTAAAVEALAASVPDSGGVVLVPAFVGMGAPHWDPHARATLFGMSRGTGAAHIARAALEAIACQSADLLATMQMDAHCALTEVRADGGAANNDLLMQFQADVLGVPVIRPQVTETTALGAAFLAGLALGFWSGRDEIAAQWQVARQFDPQIDAGARAAKLARWRRAVALAREFGE